MDSAFVKRFVTAMHQEFPRAMSASKAITFVLQTTTTSAGEIQEQFSQEFSAHLAISYSFEVGVLGRALALDCFGDPITPELLFPNIENLFSQFETVEIVRLSGSRASSKTMPYANDLIIYTNNLLIDKDEAFKRFEKLGLGVRFIEERSMFNNVFISYGGPDQEVVSRINDGLKNRGVKTWFFPENSRIGDKLHRVMSEQVTLHDKVLLVCSKNSLSRPGVLNELERVLEREAREGGSDILLPISLDDFVFSEWKPDRRDISDQIRSRVIVKIDTRKDMKMEESIARICEALRF